MRAQFLDLALEAGLGPDPIMIAPHGQEVINTHPSSGREIQKAEGEDRTEFFMPSSSHFTKQNVVSVAQCQCLWAPLVCWSKENWEKVKRCNLIYIGKSSEPPKEAKKTCRIQEGYRERKEGSDRRGVRVAVQSKDSLPIQLLFYSLQAFTSINILHIQSCLSVCCSEDMRNTRSDMRKQAVKTGFWNCVTQDPADKEEPILSVPGDLDILQNIILIHYHDDIMLIGQDEQRLLYTGGLGETHALQKKNLFLIARMCLLPGGRGRNIT
ncbi:PREDICTED: LOW QUALITY PROTEIN: uncharacterized protein LOC103590937 [Galeopterus variegatus]|uniref:LOW QUALITY PROTEIN: uncharacterized protein LOC103590937 n=1 Tax=Galeopterus variegatus TaxID=482537 RepID=A0ABM0QT15_GALVR|nr:PREDICTED: LOW QUALITY PROTEIN: uncharacterized protein LOC103590937 [Galeopterus variegatus]